MCPQICHFARSGEAEPWLLSEMPHQYQPHSKLSERSKVFTRQTQTSCLKFLMRSQTHSDECHDSTNPASLACTLNVGTTLESKLETVTYLCKLLHTSRLLQSATQFCSTSDLAKSHPSPNPQPQASSHDVLPPHRLCPQGSHGS